MSSENSLSIPIDSFEGAIREEESSQPNTEQDQITGEKSKNRSRARDELVESIKVDMGIINEPAVRRGYYDHVLRVPELAKLSNPEAYEPRVIAVGPVHHGRPHLLPMEAFKRRCAKDHIQIIGSKKVEQLVIFTEELEEALRKCYGIDSSEIPSDEFMRIMCIDSLFLVEFLRSMVRTGFYRGKWNDVIFDLVLLENQIPFFYLSKVIELKWSKETAKDMVFELWDDFIDSAPLNTGKGAKWHHRGEGHLLTRIRTRMDYKTNIKERLGYGSNYSEDRPNYSCPTISQLHRAGIRFRPSISSPPELNFQQGILRIPQFVIDHNTERLFANLVSSELYEGDCYSSSYTTLMDIFIDGPEDIRLLVESGILENHLEDDKAAADLINKLGRSFLDVTKYFRYRDLVEDLDLYCKKRWVSWRTRYFFEWKRDLKANYFSNPWKSLSVIAAVILLVLTLTQTVCSILQL